jgi:hypothetical protein
MNPCLAKLRARDHEKRHAQEPSKPSKPILPVVAHGDTTGERGFEGFEGDRSRCFSVKQTRLGRLCRTFEQLESRCPDHVQADRWEAAVAVTPAGLVQIAGRSREHVIRLTAEFFATVARDRMPFAVAAMIGDRARPGEHDVYQLAVMAGHTIAARCAMQPAIIAPGLLT